MQAWGIGRGGIRIRGGRHNVITQSGAGAAPPLASRVSVGALPRLWRKTTTSATPSPPALASPAEYPWMLCLDPEDALLIPGY